MASLTIRNLDESLKTKLRLQAAQHGCSMEQEVREILRYSVSVAPTSVGFAHKIRQRFASIEIDALPVPERQPARIPTILEE